MENFNRVFKKVFAVLTIFALFFTLNVKADENAGQVDNQVDPIEEREVDLVSPSSVPPETVSGTLDVHQQKVEVKEFLKQFLEL